MERQLLISAALVGCLAGTTDALADCAEELARLTPNGSTASMPEPAGATSQTGEAGGKTAATTEGEDVGGDEGDANFPVMGQEGEAEEQDGDTEAAQATGGDGRSGDRASTLERARLALDSGDEAGCIKAVEEAKAM